MKVLVVKTENGTRCFTKIARGEWGELMHLGSASPRIKWGVTWRAIKALRGERDIQIYYALSKELGRYMPFSTWKKTLGYIEYPKVVIERSLKLKPYILYDGGCKYVFYDGCLYSRHKDGKDYLWGGCSLREFCTRHGYKYWNLRLDSSKDKQPLLLKLAA